MAEISRERIAQAARALGPIKAKRALEAWTYLPHAEPHDQYWDCPLACAYGPPGTLRDAMRHVDAYHWAYEKAAALVGINMTQACVIMGAFDGTDREFLRNALVEASLA